MITRGDNNVVTTRGDNTTRYFGVPSPHRRNKERGRRIVQRENRKHWKSEKRRERVYGPEMQEKQRKGQGVSTIREKKMSWETGSLRQVTCFIFLVSVSGSDLSNITPADSKTPERGGVKSKSPEQGGVESCPNGHTPPNPTYHWPRPAGITTGQGRMASAKGRTKMLWAEKKFWAENSTVSKFF